jgi:hypothetical protein
MVPRCAASIFECTVVASEEAARPAMVLSEVDQGEGELTMMS